MDSHVTLLAILVLILIVAMKGKTLPPQPVTPPPSMEQAE